MQKYKQNILTFFFHSVKFLFYKSVNEAISVSQRTGMRDCDDIAGPGVLLLAKRMSVFDLVRGDGHQVLSLQHQLYNLL
jgi:hypothetical protein